MSPTTADQTALPSGCASPAVSGAPTCSLVMIGAAAVGFGRGVWQGPLWQGPLWQDIRKENGPFADCEGAVVTRTGIEPVLPA